MAKWQQYHANGPNQGFTLVNSAPATNPQWVLEIGPVGYGSPVIGTDGTIYIGTLDGELVAVNPNGTINWRLNITRTTRDKIMGSPAIGSDNNIYVVTTVNSVARDHRGGGNTTKRTRKSSLHSISPTGEVLWSTDFPDNAAPSGLGGYTNSSPKVWGSPNPFIFVPAIYETAGHAIELLIFNNNGILVHRADIASYPPEPIVADGPSLGGILDGIWDFISSPIDFDTSGVSNGPSLEKRFGWPEPSITIVDYASYEQPLIVFEDNFKTMSCFRFNPTFAIAEFLWTQKSPKVRLRSSVAAFTNGTLVVGERSGAIAAYSINTGEELGKPWYKADKPVMAPPASFGRQIYFCTDDHFIALESDYTLWQKHKLDGKCLGAPALSAKFAYVSTTDALYTFSFDLQTVVKNDDVLGGVSSPTISPNGTVYVMDLQRNLWAFGR